MMDTTHFPYIDDTDNTRVNRLDAVYAALTERAQGFVSREAVVEVLAAVDAAAPRPAFMPADDLVDRIQAQIDHAVINEHQLVPNAGKLQGDPAVRIGNLEAAIDGWRLSFARQSVPNEGRSASPQVAPTSFQARVQPWLMACFGEMIAGDREERNHRFLEEALELVQACDCTASEAHQLVDYVFGRPVGEKRQEVGGVMVTLAALCLAQGVDMHDAAEVELVRVWTMVEKIRAKQAAKPKYSPLPEAAAPVQVAPSPVPFLWVSPEQAAAHTNPDPDTEPTAGRYLPCRKTPAGKFTQPLYAAPAAPQDDARDAARSSLRESLTVIRGHLKSSALKLERAHKKSPESWIGFHDDAFLQVEYATQELMKVLATMAEPGQGESR